MPGKISGAGLASVAAGVLFLYAGLKGKSVLKSTQALVRGKSPASLQTDNPITGTATSQFGGPALGLPYGTAGATPAGPGEAAWFTALLVSIAALPTKANLTSLHNWRTRESSWNNQPPDGALYTHNPLNTTLTTSGSSGSVNSVGVQVYSSAAAGIAATAQTLLGGYPSIVSALRHGVGLSTGDPNVAAELSKWSNGGYSSV